MILDIFTFVVMIVIAAGVCFLVVKVGMLPGKIAARRNHPQAEAINVLGWIGVLTLGLAWPVALVWSFTNTASSETIVGVSLDRTDQEIIVDLKVRVNELEKQVQRLSRREGSATA